MWYKVVVENERNQSASCSPPCFSLPSFLPSFSSSPRHQQSKKRKNEEKIIRRLNICHENALYTDDFEQTNRQLDLWINYGQIKQTSYRWWYQKWYEWVPACMRVCVRTCIWEIQKLRWKEEMLDLNDKLDIKAIKSTSKELMC